MAPQHTTWPNWHTRSRRVMIGSLLGVLASTWLVARCSDSVLAPSEWAQRGSVCPVVTGPGQIPVQKADRSRGGGPSMSLVTVRGSGDKAADMALFPLDPPRASSVSPVAICALQLPWVLLLSVCLQM
jgi:hypothetical protein